MYYNLRYYLYVSYLYKFIIIIHELTVVILYACYISQRKRPSVGIFVCKKMRFSKAVQNFLKKFFDVNLLINIVYYIHCSCLCLRFAR